MSLIHLIFESKIFFFPFSFFLSNKWGNLYNYKKKIEDIYLKSVTITGFPPFSINKDWIHFTVHMGAWLMQNY